MGKIYALCSGNSDDFTCQHVILADGMDLRSEKSLYDRWYHDVYAPTCRLRHSGEPPIQRIEYKTFFEWLMEKGAREPTDDELEEFEMD